MPKGETPTKTAAEHDAFTSLHQGEALSELAAGRAGPTQAKL